MKRTILIMTAILSVFCLTACGAGKRTANVDDYVQIEISEDGTAQYVYDKEKFLEDWGDFISYTKDGKFYQYTEEGTPAEVLWNIYIKHDGFLSKSSGIQNGDKIVFEWRQTRWDEVQTYFNVDLTCTEGAVFAIAEGIEED